MWEKTQEGEPRIGEEEAGISAGRRILLVVPSMAEAGGTERMVDALSRLLDDASNRVLQATFDSPDSVRFFDSDIPIYRLGPIPRLPLPLRPFAYGLAAWRLRTLKKERKIDITISNLWGADLISVLSGGADRKISVCHTNVVENASNRLMIRFRPFVARVYRRFERVIAVSESLARELSDLYGLANGRITHIDNFVDRPATQPRWTAADGICRFVWCGRFNREKNVEGLLRVWGRFASGRAGVQLILVGDGPQKDELLALATSLGLRNGHSIGDTLSNVVFVGRSSDPASYICGARSLLLTSFAEGLPLVLLEALSLGVPVLAADCPAGGVRTAMCGCEAVELDRCEIVQAPAGLLLPIPMVERPQTVDLWQKALSMACDDEEKIQSWRRGAILRAAAFSGDLARRKWLSVLAEG